MLVSLILPEPSQRLDPMLDNIQFLRAAAASLVVMQHSIVRGESYEFPALALRALEGFGLSGVDIFFVISGFIMAYSNCQRPKNPAEFIISRFVRIVPLYYAWMALLIVLMLVVPEVFRTLRLDFEHIAFSMIFLSQAVLGEPPFIDLGWTLEFEFLFYIIFAITLFAPNSRSQQIALWLAVFAFAMIFKQLIVLEFLLGASAFFLLHTVRTHRLSLILAVAGIAGFALMHIWFTEVHRIWRWGVPAFLLVLGIASMPRSRNKNLRYLGDASYSIYLVQVASIPLFYKVASFFLSTPFGEWIGTKVWGLGDLLILGSIAFSIASGVLLYEIVERPVTRVARHLVFHDRHKPASV